MTKFGIDIEIQDQDSDDDFTIIYKGRKDKNDKKEEIAELKISKKEFLHKLRYFKNKYQEIKEMSEIFIHDKFLISDFTAMIDTIQTKKVHLTDDNYLELYQLSQKYKYNELERQIKKFISDRPDIENIISNLATENENETNNANDEDNYDFKKEEFLAKHLDFCLQSKNIKKLPKSMLVRILNSPNRVLQNHHLLFDFVTDLIGTFSKNQNSEEDKEIISMLIWSLDFQEMTTSEIEELINNEYYSNAFQPRHSSEIMKNILQENRLNKEKVQEISEKVENLEKKIADILQKNSEQIEKQLNQVREENQKEINENITNLINQIKEIDEKNQNSIQNVREESKKEINENITNLINQIKEMDEKNTNSIQNIREENQKISEKFMNEIDNFNQIKTKVEKTAQIIESQSVKISKLEKENEQKIQESESNNKSITEQIDQIKKAINSEGKNSNLNPKDVDDLIQKVNDITSLVNEGNNFNKALFNQLNGEMQLSILNELNASNYTENICKIGGLLGYLSSESRKAKKQDKQSSYVFIPAVLNTADDKENYSIIGISSSMTETLFENGELESKQFCSFIDNFTEFYLEIKYPSSNFEEIYKIALKYKKSRHSNFRIAIFVSGMEATDDKFKENCNIDYIKLDSDLREISEHGCSGSFTSCTSLKQIIIPFSVVKMGWDTFINCTSLVRISIPSSLNIIRNVDFYQCTSLKYASIPSSITEIEGYAFRSCPSLIQITIPYSVKSIGEFAFAECSSLTQVTIPSSVTKIGKEAFARCSSLTQITIPSSLKSIGEDAFPPTAKIIRT